MDDIVAAALAKWPHVPHCRGWLALDARGDWYMRDDRIQHAGPFPQVKGSRIDHDKLKAFVERIERLEEEKKAISDDIKDIYAESKGNGYDVKALRPFGDYWESLNPKNSWGGSWASFKDVPHFERRVG